MALGLLSPLLINPSPSPWSVEPAVGLPSPPAAGPQLALSTAGCVPGGTSWGGSRVEGAPRTSVGRPGTPSSRSWESRGRVLSDDRVIPTPAAPLLDRAQPCCRFLSHGLPRNVSLSPQNRDGTDSCLPGLSQCLCLGGSSRSYPDGGPHLQQRPGLSPGR